MFARSTHSYHSELCWRANEKEMEAVNEWLSKKMKLLFMTNSLVLRQLVVRANCQVKTSLILIGGMNLKKRRAALHSL